MPRKLLLASCGKVDLAEAVRSELCSTDRQSKNYRHRLLAGNRTWNKSSKNLDWKGKLNDGKNQYS